MILDTQSRQLCNQGRKAFSCAAQPYDIVESLSVLEYSVLCKKIVRKNRKGNKVLCLTGEEKKARMKFILVTI